MDFFEYASLADAIAEAFNITSPLWISMLVGGLCFLIVYIFQTVGLYTISSREGFGNKWMAFVPFLNTYYIGVCGQKNRVFNLDTKKVALVAAVIEALLFCGYVVYYAAVSSVLDYVELLETRSEVIYGQTVTYENWGLPVSFVTSHPELSWAAWCYRYLNAYILRWVEILYLFISVLVLNCFFQTYSARRYFLFTISCILFPIQGILIFAIRRNKAMSYSEYMRRTQEQAYRRYRNQQNYYQNPYDYNPYSGDYRQPPRDNPGYGDNPGQTSHRPENPFSEYGDAKTPPDDSEPFDEFKN